MGAMGCSCHRAGRLIAGVLRDALCYPKYTSHGTVEGRSIDIVMLVAGFVLSLEPEKKTEHIVERSGD
jgi:hypothetical protein